MKIIAPIRIGLAVAAMLVGINGTGQTLPPTPPTAPVPQTSPIQQAPQRELPVQQPAQRAHVELSNGMLTVAADNSSLNQILREISWVTGMKVTGGVTDERVFGNYGPADVSTVLSTLIRGTGSNMMIVLDARQTPQELVLTPRGGGPTPPNPSASRDRGEEDLPPQRTQRFARPDGFGNGQPLQAPPQIVPGQLPEQQIPQVGSPAVPATNNTTTQQSPNGVKTPQEIYDQLMKMQQQQAQPKPQ
jgi:hypothetical protein